VAAFEAPVNDPGTAHIIAHFETARHVILLALLVVAAYTDLARGKVYNWSTYPAILLGVLLAYVIGGVDGLGYRANGFNLVNSGLGILAAGGIFGLFFVLGAFGAGDVKLATAIGALSGWHFAIAAITYSALIGFVMALGLLIWKGNLARGLLDSARAAVRLKSAEKVVGKDSPALLTVPYGFALSAGTMWAWFIQQGLL
jgi:prepilin peptidase CpaA